MAKTPAITKRPPQQAKIVRKLSSLDTVDRHCPPVFPHRSPLVPTPFPLDESVSMPSHSTADPVSVSSGAGSSVNPQPGTSNAANPVITEKSSYRNFHPESVPSSTTNNPSTDISEREHIPTPLTSSTTALEMAGSNAQSQPISTPANDGASSIYAPHSTRVEPFAAVRPPMSDVASGVESDTFDHPPPSYWQNNQGDVLHGPITP